jgi:hypothetical protein
MSFTPMDFRRAMVRHLDRVDPPPPREEKPPRGKIRTCRGCENTFTPRTSEIFCPAPACQEDRRKRRKIQCDAWHKRQRVEGRTRYDTCGRGLLLKRYEALPASFTLGEACYLMGRTRRTLHGILRELVGLGLLTRRTKKNGETEWRKKKTLTCPL